MLINTKLRFKRDHCIITIYKEERQKVDISVDDILIMRLGNVELIRPVRNDFQVTLPTRLLTNKRTGTTIQLSIDEIHKKEDSITRPHRPFKGNQIDIRHFIPETTIFGHTILILKRTQDYSSIWYAIGGGVKHITIKNKVNLEKIVELLGFYYGDGSTSKYIRSFRLTNCEPSILNHCLDVLEKLSISRTLFKIQIIYSTDKELDNKTKNRCIKFWAKTLHIPKRNIKSVLPSKNIRETLKYGSARLFLDSSILVEIMLNGLLENIVKRIKTPTLRVDKHITKSFLRGLLAAEGYVGLNKNGSVVKISISFDPHSNELEFYKKILQNLDITYGKTKGNELYIYGYDNLKKIYELEGFKLHKKRYDKFIKGFKNHRKTILV